MEKYTCEIQLLTQDEGFREIESSDLVPGDVVLVPSEMMLPCDLILLTGSALVNESMLTGESVPI